MRHNYILDGGDSEINGIKQGFPNPRSWPIQNWATWVVVRSMHTHAAWLLWAVSWQALAHVRTSPPLMQVELHVCALAHHSCKSCMCMCTCAHRPTIHVAQFSSSSPAGPPSHTGWRSLALSKCNVNMLQINEFRTVALTGFCLSHIDLHFVMERRPFFMRNKLYWTPG